MKNYQDLDMKKIQDIPYQQVYSNGEDYILRTFSDEMNGGYVSPQVDGKSFTYDSRSLPYKESSMAYHQYEWEVQPISENISKALDEHPEVLNQINEERALKGIPSISKDDLNISQGIAASAFDRGGGAIQQELPLTTKYMKLLDLIGEV